MGPQEARSPDLLRSRGLHAARAAGGRGDHRPARRLRRAALFRAGRQVRGERRARRRSTRSRRRSTSTASTSAAIPTSELGLKALVDQARRTSRSGTGRTCKKAVPLDPWGRAYVYKIPGEKGDYDLALARQRRPARRHRRRRRHHATTRTPAHALRAEGDRTRRARRVARLPGARRDRPRARRPRGAATPCSACARKRALGLPWRGAAERFPVPLFSQELRVLLDAGLPLVEAIETLAQKERRDEFRARARAASSRCCARASRSRRRWRSSRRSSRRSTSPRCARARRPATSRRRSRATSPTRRRSRRSGSAWSTPRSTRCC